MKLIAKLCVIISVFACSNLYSQAKPLQDRAVIKPSLIHLDKNQNQQFKVVMLATRLVAARNPEDVIWSVNDIPGGNKKVGMIDEHGIYKAPNKIPKPGEIYIGAHVREAQNSFLFATVVFGETPPKYKSMRIWTVNMNDSESRLESPHGIGLDKEGNILIADQTAARVFRYSSSGKLKGEIGNGPGSEPGHFKEPREVQSDAAGNIYVTDSKGDRPRFQVFYQQGNFLHIF